MSDEPCFHGIQVALKIHHFDIDLALLKKFGSAGVEAAEQEAHLEVLDGDDQIDL